MAKKKQKGETKIFLIESVGDLKKQVQARQDMANTVILELSKGAKAVKVPMKYRDKTGLAAARLIQKRLQRAMDALDSECGDNQLAAPFVLEMPIKRKRKG